MKTTVLLLSFFFVSGLAMAQKPDTTGKNKPDTTNQGSTKITVNEEGVKKINKKKNGNSPAGISPEGGQPGQNSGGAANGAKKEDDVYFIED